MNVLSGHTSAFPDRPGQPANGSWIGEGMTFGLGATIEPPSVIGGGVERGPVPASVRGP